MVIQQTVKEPWLFKITPFADPICTQCVQTQSVRTYNKSVRKYNKNVRTYNTFVLTYSRTEGTEFELGPYEYEKGPWNNSYALTLSSYIYKNI